MSSIRNNIIKAITWSSVNIFGVQAVQLIIGIVLARLLMPTDFGITGILFIFIGISTTLIDGGFIQALIQKKDTNEKDFSTIFFLNILTSITLYIILFFSAPLIATFFNQPKLILYSRVHFIIILIFPLYLIQFAQLLKKLEYKSIAIVNISSIIISGSIAIILSFKGFGVWALIIQQIVFHSSRALIYPFFVKWLPTLHFSIRRIKKMLGFSLPLLGQTGLNAIFNQIYFIIIGRFYPLQQVGYFNQANRYSETVNAATQNILSQGTFPVLSTIQDDKKQLLQVYRKLIRSVATITFPLVIFLIIAAQPIVLTLITEKWLPSVVLLQLLLTANLLTPMFTVNISILNAQGFSAKSLKLELIKKSLIVVSILACFSFGIKGMLVGFVVANFLAYLFSMITIKKSLNHYYRHQILDLIKTLSLSLIVGFMIWPLQYLINHSFALLMVQAIGFLVVYFVIMRIVMPSDFQYLIFKIKR